jgi:hypothetical protein
MKRSPEPYTNDAEIRARILRARLLKNSPIPPESLVENLSLYQSREALAATLACNELYRRVVRTPGALVEFGTLWGRRLAQLTALRELYEPYNYTRRVIGFDTFTGFPGVHENDGTYVEIRAGGMAVTEGYEEHLRDVLDVHESESYNAQIRRFEIVSGDVRITLPEYLSAHPEMLVGLAYFDLDLYEPTKECLQLIRSRLVPGSVLAFDELEHYHYPGETSALLSTLDLAGAKVERLPWARSPTIVTLP